MTAPTIFYDGRLFRPVKTSLNSLTNDDTVFRYYQKDDRLTGEYSGGAIRYGQLIGLVDHKGQINMRYHHITMDGILMSGRCKSRPEVLPNGKLRLHERWQWTSGDGSKGRSVLIEI